MMRKLPALLVFVTLLLLEMLGARAVLGAVSCAVSNGVSLPTAETFNVSGGFADSFLEGAVGRWHTKCPQYGTDYPMMQVSTFGDLSINVQFNNRARDDNLSGDRCESTQVHTSGGTMTGATITIWAQERDGGACDASTEDLLVHGLGHTLGFKDVLDSSCDSTIMGTPIPGQQMSIENEHCDALDIFWNTQVESDPCTDPEVPRCECDWTEPCNPSPIVLDFDGGGFIFTGMERAVTFDIDADGFLERISWTEAGSEGFLALDRDANGTVDNGGELFGNYTLLADGSTAPHGYAALAELDTLELGGNGNGVIDFADAAFEHLRVWFDWSHDGIAGGTEVFSLEQLGFVRLELDYVTSRRRDRHGNLLRYSGKAWIRGPGGSEVPVQTTDVFFLQGEP